MSEAAKKRASAVTLSLVSTMRVPGHVIGRIVDVGEQGPRIDYPNNPHGPLLARIASSVDPTSLREANKAQEALLVFERERSDRPIVVGLLSPARRATAGASPAVDADATPKPIETLVDGRRVLVEAQDEIVLRCGEASITLRRNGRVVVRGAYVETRSRGVNRIKGGSVQIN
jgi:hypothetical protein